MKLKEIDLYITEKCNLGCEFCSIMAGKNVRKELTLEQIEKFLCFCKVHNVQEVHVTGGEPTLHPQYKEIIKAILVKGMGVRLITNGTTLKTNDLIELQKIGLKEIMISIDGMQEFHDSVRGKGMFQKTLNTVRTAIKMGFHTRVNSTAWNENLNDLPCLIRYLDKQKVDIYSIFLGSLVGRAKENNRLTVVSADRWIEFLSIIRDENKKNLNLQLIVEEGYLSRNDDIEKYSRIRSCSYILNNTDYLSVRADGNVYPCIFFSNSFQSIGNILDEQSLDFDKNLKESQFYKSVTAIPSECSDCKSRVYCKGGCRAFNDEIRKLGKDSRCLTDEYVPICPLIKLDMEKNLVAPCTDDLVFANTTGHS